MPNSIGALRAVERPSRRGRRDAGWEKIRVPRWCCVRSSRPVARVRPSLDLLCRCPCGRSACDFRLGSGLTANRINLLNASELYPAFDWASRSPRPALCYRPSLAFPRSLCSGRVTSLEPRTPHQPEKLKKLSKNDLVVRFLFLESTKTSRLYPVYFQSSAARPQAGDRIWCSKFRGFAQNAGGTRVLSVEQSRRPEHTSFPILGNL